MRITFVLPYAGLRGGIRVVAIYAEKLQAKGHKVFIISQPARPIALKEKIKCLLTGKNWPVSHLKESYFSNMDIDHKVLEQRRPIEASDAPDADAIVATFWTTAFWVDKLPLTKGAKCYFIQHHEVPPNVYQGNAETTYRLPFHKIVVSKWLQNIMMECYHDNTCDLVPNAVDLHHFTAPVRSKNDILTLGFMYSPAPPKNIELAISSVAQAKKDIPDLRVIAFGSTVPKEPLYLPDWVEFHHMPLQQDIPTLYARCDAWLFTSREEGFGLPILESMACRTPVITTNSGAAPDLITENNGAIVEPSSDAFLKQINRFKTMSNEEWANLSNNALSTARAHDWDNAADLFEYALLRATQKYSDS